VDIDSLLSASWVWEYVPDRAQKALLARDRTDLFVGFVPITREEAFISATPDDDSPTVH
jgi:hypothetical protein